MATIPLFPESRPATTLDVYIAELQAIKDEIEQAGGRASEVTVQTWSALLKRHYAPNPCLAHEYLDNGAGFPQRRFWNQRDGKQHKGPLVVKI